MARRGLIALFVLVAACKPDPRALDRSELHAAMAEDDALDRTLKQADDAEHAGDDRRALDILKRLSEPARARAATAAAGLAPRTPWGHARRNSLVALEMARKAELTQYEAAVASGDPEKKLAALQAQLETERTAAALAEEIDRAP